MTECRCSGMLTRGELGDLVERGEIETVLAVFPDMYGRLMGKRITGSLLPRGGRRRRHARLRLPARLRHGDGRHPRLQVHELGDRLRRFPLRPGPRDAAPGRLAAEDRAGAVRPLRSSREARRGLAAPHAAAPARAGPRGRLHGDGRHGDRALRLRRQLRGGAGEELPRPAADGDVQRGLPHLPGDEGGGPDRRHPAPPRPERRAGRVQQGRGRAWASRRSTSATARR